MLELKLPITYPLEMEDTEETLTEAQVAAEEFYRQSEPAPVNELWETGLARLDDTFFTGIGLCLNYEGNKLMALDCFALALGLSDRIPVSEAINPKCKPVNAVMLAKKHFADTRDGNDGKATITKCVKFFQAACKIPPMPGQRSKEGCKAMGVARKEQLKK